MIDTRNQNYSKTILQAEELKKLIDEFGQNVSLQVPQGIVKRFIASKSVLVNWVEEVEFVLENYKI